MTDQEFNKLVTDEDFQKDMDAWVESVRAIVLHPKMAKWQNMIMAAVKELAIHPTIEQVERINTIIQMAAKNPEMTN